jgi:cell division protein FtsI (penicillin-binding protein 3)
MTNLVPPPKDIPRRLHGQNRIRLIGLCFGVSFLAIAGQAGLLSTKNGFNRVVEVAAPREIRLPRPDIVDRNGVVLATDISVPSLFADPRKILEVDEAVELLTATLPDLNAAMLRERLSNRKRGFVWLRREVSPTEKEAIHNLGLPGLGFVNETKRIYPMGKLAAHVLGFVDVDSKGIAGIEKYLDGQGALYTASLADPQKHAALPAMLSIDMRVQHALTDELGVSMKRYKALAAGGIVMDATTGEVLALVSLPDFDPNAESKNLTTEQMNKMTSGVYELGSVIKAVTFAMAFDYGTANLKSRYDARHPLVIGRARISDFHAERRVLTVPEIFLHSSNIGTAKMALDVGQENHQAFLRKVGLFDRLVTEVPESAKPLLPARWSKLATATAAFGHGFAVQPLQGISVVGGLLNGGLMMTPTFLKRGPAEAEALATRIVSPETSEKMRYLFRLNAVEGTARRAEVIGYRVGGKTGTAEKVIDGRYSKNHRLTSFIGAFPMDAPRYVLIVMLDDPQPTPETMGQATSGWNAVPAAGRLIERIAPMLGVEPRFTSADLEKLAKQEKQAKKAAVVGD